jgi:hypothetical protein
MLTETFLRIPFSVIGRCSLVPTSHWLQGKCARINLSQAATGRYDFTESRITGGVLKAFLCQNRHFRAFEESYVISKEQANTLILIFSATKEQTF